MFKSGLCHILVIHIQQGSPDFDTEFESSQDGRKSSYHWYGSSVDFKKKVASWGGISDVIQFTTSIRYSSSFAQFGTFPQFLDQWKALYPIGCA